MTVAKTPSNWFGNVGDHGDNWLGHVEDRRDSGRFLWSSE